MPAYVGLDVSHATAVACFLLADGGEPVPRWAVPNTAGGAAGLAERLAGLAAQHAVDELRIGLEATGLYWWHLAVALADAPALQPYRPRVYALNPKLVETFRANDGGLPKADRLDAFLIAERVSFGRALPPPFRVDVRYAPLPRLTRFRVHLVRTLARAKNSFLTSCSSRAPASARRAPSATRSAPPAAPSWSGSPPTSWPRPRWSSWRRSSTSGGAGAASTRPPSPGRSSAPRATPTAWTRRSTTR
jgi:hypothetical protein